MRAAAGLSDARSAALDDAAPDAGGARGEASRGRPTAACDITIAVATRNRARLLPRALDSILRQAAEGVRYEAIVVDNGSTDGTRDVVGGIVARGQANLRYAFEPREGLAHARNLAISLARSPIVAFADDDQELGPGWLAAAHRALAENPDVDMVGGRTLPVWETPPPAWLLDREDRGPVSLVDGGDLPFRVNRRKWMCFGGGNFACRREALVRAGGYSPDYPRGQDREVQVRLMLSGSEGLYVPGMVMYHHVDGSRVTKAFSRRWFRTEGRMRAAYAFEELFLAPDGVFGPLPPEAPRILGVAPAIYRTLAREASRWARSAASGRREEAFRHERRLLYLWCYVRRRHELHAAAGRGTGVVRFLREVVELAAAKLTGRVPG